MAIVVGGGGASGGSGAISGGFKIFELMFNQTTDAALPAGTYRAAVFPDKNAMQAYFTKHATEFDRLKASGRVCEIGTIDAQGKPLEINNEAYSYVEGETDPWVDVVGGLIGPKGDRGPAGDVSNLKVDYPITITTVDDETTLAAPDAITFKGGKIGDQDASLDLDIERDTKIRLVTDTPSVAYNVIGAYKDDAAPQGYYTKLGSQSLTTYLTSKGDIKTDVDGVDGVVYTSQNPQPITVADQQVENIRLNESGLYSTYKAEDKEATLINRAPFSRTYNFNQSLTLDEPYDGVTAIYTTQDPEVDHVLHLDLDPTDSRLHKDWIFTVAVDGDTASTLEVKVGKTTPKTYKVPAGFIVIELNQDQSEFVVHQMDTPIGIEGSDYANLANAEWKNLPTKEYIVTEGTLGGFGTGIDGKTGRLHVKVLNNAISASDTSWFIRHEITILSDDPDLSGRMFLKVAKAKNLFDAAKLVEVTGGLSQVTTTTPLEAVNPVDGTTHDAINVTANEVRFGSPTIKTEIRSSEDRIPVSVRGGAYDDHIAYLSDITAGGDITVDGNLTEKIISGDNITSSYDSGSKTTTLNVTGGGTPTGSVDSAGFGTVNEIPERLHRFTTHEANIQVSYDDEDFEVKFSNGESGPVFEVRLTEDGKSVWELGFDYADKITEFDQVLGRVLIQYEPSKSTIPAKSFFDLITLSCSKGQVKTFKKIHNDQDMAEFWVVANANNTDARYLLSFDMQGQGEGVAEFLVKPPKFVDYVIPWDAHRLPPQILLHQEGMNNQGMMGSGSNIDSGSVRQGKVYVEDFTPANGGPSGLVTEDAKKGFVLKWYGINNSESAGIFFFYNFEGDVYTKMNKSQGEKGNWEKINNYAQEARTTFTSVDEMKAHFTANPIELKSNLPIIVSRTDSDNAGDSVENDVLLLQWTGEDSPETFDENLLVGASLMAGVSSLSLGEAHTFSSGGQNVFTINQISKSAFTSPWSEIGDHSTEAGRFVNSRPKSREYGELEYPEIAGSVADSGAVDYNVSGENPDNQSLLGIELVAAEDYTGRLSYDIKEEDTGKLVYKQIFNVDVSEGDTIDWWFNFPVDSIAGDKATAELLKADRSYMKVRPVSGGSEAYRKLKRRKFEIKELAYSGENAGDSDTIVTERVVDKDNENNSLVFNLNDVTVLNAEHAVSFRSTNRISSKIQEVDKFVVTEAENDSFSPLNMNTHEITNSAKASSDTSVPNLGQVKEFVSNHTGGRHETLITSTSENTSYQIEPAEVGLDHTQLFTVTSGNSDIGTRFRFIVPLSDDFEQGSIVEFSKKYFKGTAAEVYYFNNRDGMFTTHTLDNNIFAIQREGQNGWDIIDASDAPPAEQGIGWVGNATGNHGLIPFVESDDGKSLNALELTYGQVAGAVSQTETNKTELAALDASFLDLANSVNDDKNKLSFLEEDIAKQFEFDEVTTLEALGITDESIHAVHGDRDNIAKVFKTGKVRDGNKYVLTMNEYVGKDLHGFLPTTTGGIFRVTSAHSYTHRDPSMIQEQLPPFKEHRVIFEWFDTDGGYYTAFLDQDDLFTDWVIVNDTSQVEANTTEIANIKTDVSANTADISTLTTNVATNTSELSETKSKLAQLDVEVTKVENVIGIPNTQDINDLGITEQQVLDANGDTETILRLFRNAKLNGASSEYHYVANTPEGNDFYGFLPDTDGGVFSIIQYVSLADPNEYYTLAQYISEENVVKRSVINFANEFDDWAAHSGGDSVVSLRNDFEKYKTVTNATISRLEETIGTLQTLIESAFNQQELTYSGSQLTSTMTNIKGETSESSVHISSGGGSGDVPDTFNVYVGWDSNDAVTAEEIKQVGEHGKVQVETLKSELLTKEFTTTRTLNDEYDYKFSFIAFPKNAVEPDPDQVNYNGAFPASWNRHEVLLDDMTYVVLMPEYANNESAITITLVQS